MSIRKPLTPQNHPPPMSSSMSLLFLGTSGSVPTPARNVTSVALKIGKEILLFDCGEGTQRQFMLSPFSFMQVSRIFVSHLHGDHFLGVNGLVQTMSFNGRKEALEIYGPEETESEMTSFLNLGYFDPSFKITVRDLKDGETVDFGEYSVTAACSDHTVPSLAYAVQEKARNGKFNRAAAEGLGLKAGPLYRKLQGGATVEFKGKTITPEMVMGPSRPGRKVVFSGDTKPCESVTQLAKDCDVLIHEGTVESPLEEKTNPYGHSSARQAAMIAKDAGARALFLVHISPRYEKTDGLLLEAKGIFSNTTIAEDLMVFDIKYRD